MDRALTVILTGSILLGLLAVGGPAHAVHVAPIVAGDVLPQSQQQPAPLIQVDANAYSHGNLNGFFWQNTTTEYGTGSALPQIPTELTGTAVTLVYQDQLTVAPSFASTASTAPRVATLNLTQGTRTLGNATVPTSFEVNPYVSPTHVGTKVPSALDAAGLLPAEGRYALALNYTIAAHYLTTATPVWQIANGSVENLTYGLDVPSAYVMNATSVTIPFPVNVAPNQTTVRITTYASGKTVNVSTYYLALGAVVVLLPGLSTSETVNVSYLARGLTAGSTPIIQLGPVYQLPNGRWQANASWVNPSTLPWAGAVLIQTNQTLGHQIEAASLNVTANHQDLYGNTYVLVGNAVLILPGSVTIYGGRPMVFQLTFSLSGVAQHIGLCLTCSIGASAVRWWQLAVGAELLFGIGAVLSVSQSRRHKIVAGDFSGFRARTDGNDVFWACVYGAIAVGLLLLVAVVAGA